MWTARQIPLLLPLVRNREFIQHQHINLIFRTTSSDHTTRDLGSSAIGDRNFGIAAVSLSQASANDVADGADIAFESTVYHKGIPVGKVRGRFFITVLTKTSILLAQPLLADRFPRLSSFLIIVVDHLRDVRLAHVEALSTAASLQREVCPPNRKSNPLPAEVVSRQCLLQRRWDILERDR